MISQNNGYLSLIEILKTGTFSVCLQSYREAYHEIGAHPSLSASQREYNLPDRWICRRCCERDHWNRGQKEKEPKDRVTPASVRKTPNDDDSRVMYK